MDEETKKKIWETFKEVFIEEGIASPDDVEFKSGSLPTEEVHRHGGFMRKLGRCGKAIVWLIKGGWKVGKVGMVAGWIIIMVADLPDAIVKIHTRYPKAQEVVKNVGEIVRDWSAPNEKQAGFMVVIDPKWEINLEKYHKDIANLNISGHIPNGAYVCTTSAMNEVQVQDLTYLSSVDSDLSA